MKATYCGTYCGTPQLSKGDIIYHMVSLFHDMVSNILMGWPGPDVMEYPELGIVG